MRHILCLFFFCFLLQNCESEKQVNSEIPQSHSHVKKANAPFFLGGIQVNEEDINHWTKTVKNIGMNTVEVTVYIKHWMWNTEHLTREEEEKWVIEEIRAAKAEGLKVVLILRIALQHYFPENQFLWHGMIIPQGEKSLNKWFEDYQKFALDWAGICEKEGVDVLGIGSEMNAMTATKQITEMPDLYAYYENLERQREHENRALKYQDILGKHHLWVRGEGDYETLEAYIDNRINANKKWVDLVTFAGEENRIKKMNNRRQFIESQWIEMIQKIRKVYNGKLTYAANFDNYMDVGFWEYLDFVGINAYFKLREPNQDNLSDSEMKPVFRESWKRILNEINQFKSKEKIGDKPVLFTELGYVKVKDSSLAPWQGFGFSIVGSDIFEKIILWDSQPLKPVERQLAVEALNEAVESENFNLAGILYWKLTTHPYHLEHEPFALHISENLTDSLQTALLKFVQN